MFETIPNTNSSFELTASASELLATMIDDPSLHARWLATLGYLENCGAHLIFRYKSTRSVGLDLLQHAAEEARHAYFFTKHAWLVSPDPKPWSGPFGRRYLERLAVGIGCYLRPSHSPDRARLGSYLLTTWAIEQRAMAVYGSYEQQLRRVNHDLTLRPILAEEREHLRQIEAGIVLHGFQADSAWASAAEAKLFADFWSEMAGMVAPAVSHMV